ncbi:PH domain-containing protein [Liquorilactobacillus satsumensis]|uniref:PH domain-containing protein n=1 Tax=Liquorilactobacillus TaxID=2767888 RepID=UPI0007053CA4|nr:PH domain-containing protein [Liquorilactobacillus satsumensis]MCC7666261.1 hypothetical protein [Liquorilactobacillus satsumensis]MCP9313699.1 PH domain-containing protein [Liquorilactobacillus satsumensis]MCP9327921.1 PH domain-containing protein [Liquorilactobacillus satsumensis]MCP9358063.1 PH domain-containing protein [Liquorilactobacillus satsumensis]MCP9360815.1 PH domain-containing protein [Liquorilactobacillus satsumensis]
MNTYPLLRNLLPLQIKVVWFLRALLDFCISLVLTALVWCLAFKFWNPSWLYTAGFAVLALIVVNLVGALLLIPYRYAFHRYEINSEELAFQKGFFFRQTVFVPLVRIQHVETRQGPLLRQQKLMSLVVYTAATEHQIAGLSSDEAFKLRNQILHLVKAVREDV